MADFDPLAAYRQPLERLGYVYRADNPERTKRYFREPSGRRRTHVHVRQAGSFSEQWALLFRDYLRAHPDAAAAYARLKHALAERFGDDLYAYTDIKDPACDLIMVAAEEWAAGSRLPRPPGPSDTR